MRLRGDNINYRLIMRSKFGAFPGYSFLPFLLLHFIKICTENDFVGIAIIVDYTRSRKLKKMILISKYRSGAKNILKRD